MNNFGIVGNGNNTISNNSVYGRTIISNSPSIGGIGGGVNNSSLYNRMKNKIVYKGSEKDNYNISLNNVGNRKYERW